MNYLKIERNDKDTFINLDLTEEIIRWFFDCENYSIVSQTKIKSK